MADRVDPADVANELIDLANALGWNFTSKGFELCKKSEFGLETYVVTGPRFATRQGRNHEAQE